MGAYGSPEHLPGENQEPEYQHLGRRDILHGDLKTWQKVLLIVYLCIAGLFALIMLVGLSGYTGNMAIGIISAIAFIGLAILFAVRAGARKRAWPFIVFSVAAFFTYFGAMGSSETSVPPAEPVSNATVTAASSEADSSAASKVQSQASEQETAENAEAQYKIGCATFVYKDIARNPNDYKGKKAKFTGQVAQVQESWGTDTIRLNVTKGDYGSWDDTVYIEYKPKSDNESRILEEDILTVYGELGGIKKYIAVLGNEISLPYLKAEYVEINPETGSITKAKYDKIKAGMSYEQVKKIIGSDGKVLSEVGKKGSKDYTVTYEWDGDKAGNMAMLVFQGNKLISQNQSGLE